MSLELVPTADLAVPVPPPMPTFPPPGPCARLTIAIDSLRLQAEGFNDEEVATWRSQAQAHARILFPSPTTSIPPVH